jgi:hypothetical protein
MKFIRSFGSFVAFTAVVAVLANASASHALSRCKVKVSKRDGTISVSASDVTGPLQWGDTEGTMSNAFFNIASCVLDGTAKGCVLGDVDTAARIMPPPMCKLYVTDGTGDCSVYIAGCVPGNRVTCLSQTGTNAVFEGCNVHVRDASGDTDGTTDGLGNLIVGWNENPSNELQTGSNNLVVGPGHKFTSYGGMVAGADNAIIDQNASVTGGRSNIANGAYASISGGYSNHSFGTSTWIGGGQSNEAYGSYTSVAGGASNSTSGNSSFVGGGQNNNASAEASAIAGGIGNATFGPQTGSSILGGSQNIASGGTSTISGGVFNEATGGYSSIGGGNSNVASADGSSVSGGLGRTASGLNDWRAGTLFEDQ